MADAVTALTREIMTLQAEGSYEKAKALIDDARRGPAAGAEGARPARVGAGRHRAAVHVGGDAAVVAVRGFAGPRCFCLLSSVFCLLSSVFCPQSGSITARHFRTKEEIP